MAKGTTVVSREKVFAVVVEERDYQDLRWGDLDTRNGPADFLLYMKQQLDKAIYQYNADEPVRTLDQVRKVTALGVACMEWCGAPRRE